MLTAMPDGSGRKRMRVLRLSDTELFKLLHDWCGHWTYRLVTLNGCIDRYVISARSVTDVKRERDNL